MMSYSNSSKAIAFRKLLEYKHKMIKNEENSLWTEIKFQRVKLLNL